MSHKAQRVVTGAERTVTSQLAWKWLTRIDEDLAASQASQACPHCGVGRLHRANYSRAALGVSTKLGREARRFSLCCNKDGCRKRVQPDSVRYFGRRHYVAPVFLLVAI